MGMNADEESENDLQESAKHVHFPNKRTKVRKWVFMPTTSD